jgi:TetR/AcrR family transcriptional repressor of nem operon
MKTEPRIDTREAILSAARLTVQKNGYNTLSFRDLAEDVGIKSASVHYHFPTKGDLAEAVMARFADDFNTVMEPHSDKPFDEAIDAYLALFRVGFDGSNRMCVGGMMAAEVTALPSPARGEIDRFAKAHIDWLKGVLSKKHKRMTADKLEAKATAIFAAMEGAQLIARGLDANEDVFNTIVDTYKASGLLD